MEYILCIHFLISTQWEFKYIRKNILKSIQDIVKDLPLTVKPYQLVDEAVIHENAWFMYGSKKKNNKFYNLTYIFNYDMECMVMDDSNTADFVEENELSLSELFSIRDASNRTRTVVKQEMISKIPKSKRIRKKYVKRSRRRNNMIMKKLNKLCKSSLLHVLKITIKEWKSAGFAYNIDSTNNDLLELWIEFAEKADKPNRRLKCESEWKNMKDTGLGIGTLYFFAKCDNEELYNELIRTRLKTYIDDSIGSQSDYDLSKVLHEMYKHQFVCASVKKKGDWYIFSGHRWEMMEEDTELYNKISTKMCEEYCRRLSVLNLESVNDDATEEERENAKNKGVAMIKLILKLKTNSSKEAIMRETKKLTIKSFEEIK